jgi:hypothetical protein
MSRTRLLPAPEMAIPAPEGDQAPSRHGEVKRDMRNIRPFREPL